jgi:membrane-associated phospholipid phosphatase
VNSGIRSIIVVFLLGVVPAFSQDSLSCDVRLFRLINEQQNPEQTGFFEVLDKTSLPSFAIVPVSYGAYHLARGGSFFSDDVVVLITAQMSTLATTTLLKVITDRSRPFEALHAVRLKHEWSATGSSFPSGHTSMAFAVATFFSLRYPNSYVWIPAFAWAGAIGYGRMYLGVHYPTDVLAGMLIGSAVAWGVWQNRAGLIRAKDRLFGIEKPSERFGEASVPILRFSLVFN